MKIKLQLGSAASIAAIRSTSLQVHTEDEFCDDGTKYGAISEVSWVDDTEETRAVLTNAGFKVTASGLWCLNPVESGIYGRPDIAPYTLCCE